MELDTHRDKYIVEQKPIDHVHVLRFKFLSRFNFLNLSIFKPFGTCQSGPRRGTHPPLACTHTGIY